MRDIKIKTILKKMLACAMSFIMILGMMASSFYAGIVLAEDDAVNAESVLENMTLEEQVTQMIVPEFGTTWDEEGSSSDMTELTEDARTLLETFGFGGVFFLTQNLSDQEQTVRLMNDIQTVNASKSNRTQLFTFVDQEGGSVSRINFGTSFCGNMGLSSLNNQTLAGEAINAIGKECSALGFNCNFAPVLDVNNNPSNPVINIRSFSDDPDIVSEYGNLYIDRMNENNVNPIAQFFPGHGNTFVDGQTGFSAIYATEEELYETELKPFISAFEHGLDMVTIAHVQYPNMITETAISKDTQEEITLPATLSKSMITDLLRGELGYNGLVITDAMDREELSKHFDLMDSTELAILAGNDLLLMPVSTSQSQNWKDQMTAYIQNVVELAENNEEVRNCIYAANLRILEKKEESGLLNGYAVPDETKLQEKIDLANSIVGSEAHRNLEWEVVNKSFVLLKNDHYTLPLKGKNESVLICIPFENDQINIDMGIQLAREDGLIPAGSSCSVFCYSKSTSNEKILSQLDGVQHLVIFSKNYNYAPQSTSGKRSALIDAMIEEIHKKGGDCTLISSHLPYDAARFQAADAILLCWDNEATTEEPLAIRGQSMTAVTHMLFEDAENGPTGKLPVNIPYMEDDSTFMDPDNPENILYSSGYGLNYRIKKMSKAPLLDKEDKPSVMKALEILEILKTGVENQNSIGLILALGLILLAVIIGVFAFVLKRKQKKGTANDDQDPDD